MLGHPPAHCTPAPLLVQLPTHSLLQLRACPTPSGVQVGLITCAMVMCGFINMSVLRMGATLTSDREEAVFLTQCRAFACRCVRDCAWVYVYGTCAYGCMCAFWEGGW